MCKCTCAFPVFVLRMGLVPKFPFWRNACNITPYSFQLLTLFQAWQELPLLLSPELNASILPAVLRKREGRLPASSPSPSCSVAHLPLTQVPSFQSLSGTHHFHGSLTGLLCFSLCAFSSLCNPGSFTEHRSYYSSSFVTPYFLQEQTLSIYNI